MSQQHQKIPLLVLSGPTASGKTALSVAMAKHLGAQIVCADSMQIYDGISIGTARPDEQEMQGIPHHLFGFLPVTQSFNVAQYTQTAHHVIRQIHQQGSLPFLCGGTGLYIQAVTENLSYTEQPTDPKQKEKLQQRIQQEGGDVLLEELRGIDPQAAQKLHPNDHGRIIRALELFYSTGHTLTEQNQLSRRTPSPYQVCHLTLDYRNREILYHRIHLRVDGMMQQGLEQEAIDFFKTPNTTTAAQAIGYKELKPYLEGDCSRVQALENLKQATRRYAKRQLSWFRNMPNIHTIYCDDYANFDQLLEGALKTVSFR